MQTADNNLVRVAIEVCCNEKFKSEILIVPENDSDAGVNSVFLCKRTWDKRVRRRASAQIDKYNLEHYDKKKVLGIISCITMRMLTWVEYFSGNFALPRDYCMNILTTEALTEEGLINEEKILDILSFNRNLSKMQEYKLACYYCTKEKIAFLFKLLTAEERRMVYDPTDERIIIQPRLVTFWSFFVMGDIDKLKGGKSVDQFKLQCAISSGSKLAVQYCLEKTSLVKKRDNIVDAAVAVIKQRMFIENKIQTPNSNFKSDLVIFEDKKCKTEFEWVPNHWFADILFYLLSKTTDEQKTEISRKLFITLKPETFKFISPSKTKVLQFFLLWPYQDQFMEFVNLSWTWLPERIYGNLLLFTFQKIEIDKGDISYGEHKCYEYKKLVMKLWKKSPDSFKRYAFRDKSISFKTDSEHETSDSKHETYVLKEAKELIVSMFHLIKFNAADMINVKSILSSATEKERADFLLSEDGRNICGTLLLHDKKEYFDQLVRCCLPSENKAMEFRKQFSIVVTSDVCIDHIENNRWDEAESAVRWCDMTDQDIQTLKQAILLTEEGKKTCRKLYSVNVKTAERFIKWGYSDTGSIETYKKMLLIEEDGLKYCKQMLVNGSMKELNSLVKWVFSTHKERNKFKRKLASKSAFSICQDMILRGKTGITDDSKTSKTIWERIDDFLSWCFLNEDSLFKQKFLKETGENLFLELLQSGQLRRAEELLIWLEPSQINTNLFKRKIFYDNSIGQYFDCICKADVTDDKFIAYGTRENAIKQILRWFLVDADSINEFTIRNCYYGVDQFITTTVHEIEKSVIS